MSAPIPTTTVAAAPRPKRPKWYYVYFVLAAFDLFTVSAGFYLTYRIMGIYTQSVEVNRVWTVRAAEYSKLGELAGEVNAPGNDVFDSQEVANESQRMHRALEAFEQKIAEHRAALASSQEPALAGPLLGHLDEVSAAMLEMTNEAELIFTYFNAHRPDLAGRRMATMDRKFARVTAALSALRATVGEILQRNLDSQSAAAKNIQGYEYAIGILILMMVLGAILYGHKIARQMQSDAAERERHLDILGEAEARMRSVLDTAADGIVIFDESGRIETFNQAAEQLFGYANGSAIGADVRTVAPALWRRAKALDDAACAADAPVEGPTACRRDGSVFPIEISISTIRRNGRPLHTAIVRDVSELRQAEASRRAAAAAEAANAILQREEQRLRWLNEIGQHAEAADSVDAVLRYGLDSVCGFTGWPVGHAWVPAEDDHVLVSSGFWSITDEVRYAAFRDASAATRFTAEAGGLVESVLSTRQAVWIDRIDQGSGRAGQHAMAAAGLHAACAVPIVYDNEIEAVLEFLSPEVAAPDAHFLEFLKQAGTMLGAIVRRKRDAAELKKLALIVRESDDAVVITGRDRRIEWVNPGFTAITGYLLSEVVGHGPGELLQGPETDPATVAELRQALDAGLKIEAEIVNYAKGGRKFWMRLSVQPMFDQGGKIERYVAIQQDITERKRSQDALRDKEEELRSVVDNLADGVVSINTKGIVCSFNGSAERIFGYPANEVIGRNVNMLMPEPHHTAHDTYLENHVRTGERKIVGIGREVEGRRKDGTLFPVDLAVSNYKLRGERFFTGILRDITERKRVNEALQSAMHGAEESSRAKSAFLAAMSHELRTPMNGVVGMIDVLWQTELDADQREMMGTARESAFSLLGVIDEVLDFSKIEAGKLELERVPVSLAKMVEGVCETLLPIAHKKHVELIVFCDPRLPDWVLADPVRLRQVLFNLAGNAVKFSGSEAGRPGRVFIRADLIAAADERVRVGLQIADNGIGMDKDAVTRLFQPFTQAESSTTRRFGGTGLGLSICARLVELMNGTIGVESSPGEGSVFRVELDLPQASGRAVQSLPFKLDDLDVVLLADDAEMREILDRYLSCGGIRVLPARTADEAVRHAKAVVADGSPLVIVVVDAEGEQAVAALGDRLAGRATTEIIRYVVVQRGRRRKARGNDRSSVTLDANAMRRMSFLRAVAIAAGRASPEQDAAPAELMMAVAAPISVAEAERAGRLILIAEDNKTNQKVILRQLALLGYAAEVAGNGREALQRWREKSYALLLTDCHMPEMDGFELVASIRRDEADGRRAPIVAITANALSGEAERCLAAGMDDYLAKPVQLTLLRDMLARWMPGPGVAGGEPSVPARVAVAAAAAVDPDALKEIVGDDPEVIAEFLGDFGATAKESVDELVLAGDERSASAIAAVAHRLKSSARAVGAGELADLCQTLETAGNAADWSTIERVMPDLAPALAAVEDFIENFTKQVT